MKRGSLGLARREMVPSRPDHGILHSRGFVLRWTGRRGHVPGLEEESSRHRAEQGWKPSGALQGCSFFGRRLNAQAVAQSCTRVSFQALKHREIFEANGYRPEWCCSGSGSWALFQVSLANVRRLDDSARQHVSTVGPRSLPPRQPPAKERTTGDLLALRYQWA